MNSNNIGDKLKINVNNVLTGGGITDDLKKYFDIDEADKRKKLATKKADNHMMPEPTSIDANNKNEKKLLEDISVFLNQLEAKHQESNVRKRNKLMNGSRNIAVNLNKDAAAAHIDAATTTATTTTLRGGFVNTSVANKVPIPKGGSGRMYNKCRKLEDDFSGIF
jgi:hypothetical protein